MNTLDLRKPEKRSGTTFGDIVNGGVSYQAPLWFGSYTQNNFLSIPAVYAALDLISSSVALMPLQVCQRKENQSTILDGHPLLKLFDEMIQSKFTLFRMITWDILWHGNSFVYIKRGANGIPVSLTYLPHGDVTINYNKPKGTVTYQVVNHLDIKKEIPQKDMLHFLKNTKDGVVGIGLLAYASESFKLTDNLNNSASDFFGSGCGISGILKFKGQVPEKSKAEIRQQWSQIHAPGANGAGLAITSSDCDYVPVSQDPSSSQMLESRQFAIAEVARFFGISPLLLQSLENGNTTAIEQISLQFVKYTLMPLVKLIENELNRKLFPGVFDTWIDLDETILLASDKQSLANYLSTLTQNGIMSINEARRQLDLNEVEGGDALIIPYTDLGMNTLNGDTNTTNNIDGEQTQ
jgi:HK97 family phage portal protein